jgi:hypothetical protein
MKYLFMYIDLIKKNKADKLFTKAKAHLNKLSYLQSIDPYAMQNKFKNKFKNKFNTTIHFIKLFIKNMPTNQKKYKNKD